MKWKYFTVFCSLFFSPQVLSVIHISLFWMTTTFFLLSVPLSVLKMVLLCRPNAVEFNELNTLSVSSRSHQTLIIHVQYFYTLKLTFESSDVSLHTNVWMFNSQMTEIFPFSYFENPWLECDLVIKDNKDINIFHKTRTYGPNFL